LEGDCNLPLDMGCKQISLCFGYIYIVRAVELEVIVLHFKAEDKDGYPKKPDMILTNHVRL
ncbi:MAG: hypothetical protein QNJ46_31545, partial [Leptolyngbyaceae cyanobacterium MO_188.B28]|nr:hypothetical protein [Leptolyngbyaceae cyanobacterium MO_188.B28]